MRGEVRLARGETGRSARSVLLRADVVARHVVRKPVDSKCVIEAEAAADVLWQHLVVMIPERRDAVDSRHGADERRCVRSIRKRQLDKNGVALRDRTIERHDDTAGEPGV